MSGNGGPRWAAGGPRWATVTGTLAVLAIMVSLTLMQGQMHGRIDDMRREVLEEVRDLREDMQAEFAKLNARA